MAESSAVLPLGFQRAARDLLSLNNGWLKFVLSCVTPPSLLLSPRSCHLCCVLEDFLLLWAEAVLQFVGQGMWLRGARLLPRGWRWRRSCALPPELLCRAESHRCAWGGVQMWTKISEPPSPSAAAGGEGAGAFLLCPGDTGPHPSGRGGFPLPCLNHGLVQC